MLESELAPKVPARGILGGTDSSGIIQYSDCTVKIPAKVEVELTLQVHYSSVHVQ